MGQIRNDSLERQYLIEHILADMLSHRSAYNSTIMKCLFGLAPMSNLFFDVDSDVGRFLSQGYRITFDDLFLSGVLPSNITGLKEAVFKEDTHMPLVEVMGYEEPAKGRTDVYFLGLPGSGRSSILSGLLTFFNETGRGLFLPRTNINYSRRGDLYSKAMVDGLGKFKVPEATIDTSAVIIPYNLGEKLNREVTFIECGGEALIRLSNANQDNPEAWEKERLCRCLKNNNPKTLFFVLSYDMIINDNPSFSEPHQAEILENVLLALNSNGDGKKGERNCTMSTVNTVAVIISKSDIMKVGDGGKAKIRMRRRDIAMKYIDSRFRLFMNNLDDMCEKYSINKENYYKPYVYTFSLGNFYVGNSVVYDLTDAECISNLLIKTTQKNGIF